MQRLVFFILFSLFMSSDARSQTFNYSFASDSSAWQELTSQTLLNTVDISWNSTYRVPIGFSFSYLGRTFDSVTIETNGYVVFDAESNYAFTSFNAFRDKLDNEGHHSVLSYTNTGTAPNRTLKIQYKNVAQADDPAEILSYQIWLHENGEVEVRIGPNSYGELVMSDTTQALRLGPLNKNMNTPVNSFFASGNPRAASGHTQDETHPDAGYLYAIPFVGWRYRFIPMN